MPLCFTCVYECSCFLRQELMLCGSCCSSQAAATGSAHVLYVLISLSPLPTRFCSDTTRITTMLPCSPCPLGKAYPTAALWAEEALLALAALQHFCLSSMASPTLTNGTTSFSKCCAPIFVLRVTCCNCSQQGRELEKLSEQQSIYYAAYSSGTIQSLRSSFMITIAPLRFSITPFLSCATIRGTHGDWP
jgi:hypothetical protein